MALVCLFIASNLTAQTFFNREWQTHFGNPVSVDWSKSTTDGSGNLISIGTTFQLGSQYDILLIKYDSEGNVIWQRTIDVQSGPDYGINLTTNQNDDIYIVGAYYNPINSSQDIYLEKFNSSGVSQWSVSNQGNTALEDIPIQVIEDAGDLFVIAKVEGSTSGADIRAMKFDDQGVHDWTATYDFNGNSDVPVEANSDGNGGLLISGYSANSLSAWDMVVLEYDGTGVLTNSFRSAFGTGLDSPTSIAEDASGNLWLTGYVTAVNDNRNIAVVKLNANLSLNWVREYDWEGHEDLGSRITVDAAGNAYVLGQSVNDNGGTNLTLLRYNPNGVLDWETRINAVNDADHHLAKYLDWADDLLLVGCDKVDSADTNVLITAWTTDGEMQWYQEIEKDPAVLANKLTDVQYQGNQEYFIYYKNVSLAAEEYGLEKWSLFTADTTDNRDTNGVAIYPEDRLIVRFDRVAIDPSLANEKTRDFLTLEDLLTTDAFNDLDASIGEIYDLDNTIATKVVPWLNLDDETWVSKYGITIDLKPLSEYYVLHFPASIDESIAIADLESVEFITSVGVDSYIHFNSSPNDPKLSLQKSVVGPNTSYAGDIEAEGAWDVQVGKDNVRVAVFDSGLQYDHEDFTYEIALPGGGTTEESKVIGGYDISGGKVGIPLLGLARPNQDEGSGHGTLVAGIIGAIRDNNKGIAGIAGGDATNSNYGCELIGYKMAKKASPQSEASVSGVPVSFAFPAILYAASDIDDKTNNGTQADIINASWYFGKNTSFPWPFIPHKFSGDLQLAGNIMGIVNQLGKVFVASRGIKVINQL
ncbi:S8 family serine peptidase [bacterium SCSIO 12741]|nr:S8 family serine peptidase [bacterium SCSIO 12741]